MKKYIISFFVFSLFLSFFSLKNVYAECKAGYTVDDENGHPCDSAQNTILENKINQSFSKIFTRNLQLGLKGEDVKSLQGILKEEGYYFGKIDGSYGKRSVRAVKEFQDDNEIAVTGNVDTVTLGKLKQVPLPKLCNVAPIVSSGELKDFCILPVVDVTVKKTYSNPNPEIIFPEKDSILNSFPTKVVWYGGDTGDNFSIRIENTNDNSGVFARTVTRTEAGCIIVTDKCSFSISFPFSPILQNEKQIEKYKLSIKNFLNNNLRDEAVFKVDKGNTLFISPFNQVVIPRVGLYFSVPFNVSGLPGPVISTNNYTWSVVEGALPDGLSLKMSEQGEILAGTPTRAGTFNFTLSASILQNGSYYLGKSPFTLNVLPALPVIPTSTNATPVSTPPSVTSMKGYDLTTNIYTPNEAIAGKYLVLFGSFNETGNTVRVGNNNYTPTYQSRTQINVLLGAETGNMSVVVSNANGTSIPSNINIRAPQNTASIFLSGVQGYNPDSGVYTNGQAHKGKYLILYGSFPSSLNTVKVGDTVYTPTYQSATQINVLLGENQPTGTFNVIVANGSLNSNPMSLNVSDSITSSTEVSISANPARVSSGGSSVISWSCPNFDSGSVSFMENNWVKILAQGVNGSQNTGSLTSSRIFTLTCAKGTQTLSKTVTVSVN